MNTNKIDMMASCGGWGRSLCHHGHAKDNGTKRMVLAGTAAVVVVVSLLAATVDAVVRVFVASGS
jgi:hypothetical protein